ncbi:MAG: histidine phosphatase family protein [Chloroflexi bacterium]|nr:MAG: histidine phosphatase family protein [Chloroflexota bacterium]
MDLDRGARAIASRCRLFLIRHGAAAMPDERGRILNYSDAPLTAVGRAQAERVAAALDGVGVDAVVSSDLARAVETAEIVARGRPPALVDPRLREVDLGDYDGFSFAQVSKVDPRFVSWPGVAFHGRLARASYHVPADLAFPGGESARTMTARLVPALVDLATAWAGRTLAVVTHGWAIQGLLCHATGIDVAGYFRFTYANASTTLVEVDRGGRGALLLHNADLDLERATGGRIGETESDERRDTCRVAILCVADPGDAPPPAQVAELCAAGVRAAPQGVDADPRACLVRAAAEGLGAAAVLVATPASAATLAAHVLDDPGAAARLPALPGGLGLAEVEPDGRGALHVWNGRIAARHVPPG